LTDKIVIYDKYLSNFVKNLTSLSDDKDKVYRPSSGRGIQRIFGSEPNKDSRFPEETGINREINRKKVSCKTDQAGSDMALFQPFFEFVQLLSKRQKVLLELVYLFIFLLFNRIT
jgi:hypothetical protein